LRYLWIDRYCNNHSDAIEHWDEIEKMSNICMRAFVTLIAPGPHENYGLPDFSQLSEENEVTRMSHASRWQERASSYREQICARRVLFF
jgi:hypothetical protein